MNGRLDKYLCKKYPHVFSDRYASMQTTAMCWGFDCGSGWYQIIKKAASKLEPLIIAARAENPEAAAQGFFRASQIKEKWGTLCFYLSGGTDEMYSIVEEAARKSAKICETCGKPGRIRKTHGWLTTRCAKCARDL